VKGLKTIPRPAERITNARRYEISVATANGLSIRY
jgi:hypothetical protein